MKKIRKIHFTGIKGVGMTPLAIIAHEAGISVTGSDVEDEFITDVSLKKAGINPLVGFAAEDIGDVDLLITTGAHGGLNNPQVQEAVRRKIPVWTQGQAVGEFMKGEVFEKEYKGISVAGSHGKTTTTAIIATIFKECNLDPAYVIGTSEILSLGLPGHFGKGKFFIAEADEYATDPEFNKMPKFMWQKPQIEVITNIELDHPDLYENVEALVQDFKSFIGNLDKNGLLVICLDDYQNRKIIKEVSGTRNIITYGFSPMSDYVISRFSQDGESMYFWINHKGTSLGEFSVALSGEFNALNSLAGIITAIEAGLPIDKIQSALQKYKGAKRRFEHVGKLASGALLYDDYAHHPTEIRKTLKAFHESFKDKKLVCIFQPHTYSRTKALLEDFTSAFSYADTVVIADIYSSLREDRDDTVSSQILVKKMSSIHNGVVYAPSLADVVKYISHRNYNEDYIVVTMGAGDIYKIKDSLDLVE